LNDLIQNEEFNDLALEISNDKSGDLYEFKTVKVNSAILAAQSNFVFEQLKKNAKDK
jgi:hypothetical protein